MKIIKEGKPELKFRYNYQAECIKCNCRFEFLIDDIHESMDGTRATFKKVNCPWCGSKISIGNLYEYSKIKETYDDFLNMHYAKRKKILPNYYSQSDKLRNEKLKEKG